MKGKISFYFALPNLARLRSRLVEPPKELSAEVRAKLTEFTVEVANEANLKLRAKMIDYIAGRSDLKFASEKHKQQVTDITSGIFDSLFTVDAESLDALVGKSEKSDKEEKEDAGPGNEEENTEKPEAEAAPKTKAAPKADAAKTEAAKPAADSEFND
jgi:hypothetical protein